MGEYLDAALERLEHRNTGQEEFLQAVREVVKDLDGQLEEAHCVRENLFERLTEPDRVVSFRVCWEDDEGYPHVNRGWRVQHNNAIGPYKGGLRFHPTVNESILKFLAFEQMFKNALTGLSIGAGKGGSDFDPRGRSDREIMRFCQSFMDELQRHIGDRTDVPAGDINVGSREIGYLFGRYKKVANNFSGVLTGKSVEFGGSDVRMEATGFGLVYFVEAMLARCDDELTGKRVAVSGAGNVALHAALKAAEEGAVVCTLSASNGYIVNEDGFKVGDLRKLLTVRGSSRERLQQLPGDWHDEGKPWTTPCDIALPCATQNELGRADAEALVKNGCQLVAEGANMPCDEEATTVFLENRLPHAPGKAANAGGVSLSTLEMSQNANFHRRAFEDLDDELRRIMRSIHGLCVEHGGDGDFINYRLGANQAAFKRIAAAMIAQGIN